MKKDRLRILHGVRKLAYTRIASLAQPHNLLASLSSNGFGERNSNTWTVLLSDDWHTKSGALTGNAMSRAAALIICLSIGKVRQILAPFALLYILKDRDHRSRRPSLPLSHMRRFCKGFL